MAFDVNQVWNTANADSAELSWVGIPKVGYMNCGTSACALMKDLKGMRKQFKKNKLNWRCSGGAKKL